MRDISGFVETRFKLLAVKPSNRNHWISFAVGHHLEGNYEVAVQIINQYETTLVRSSTAVRIAVHVQKEK
jgi:peptide alpha-N-acetyltransferase